MITCTERAINHLPAHLLNYLILYTESDNKDIYQTVALKQAIVVPLCFNQQQAKLNVLTFKEVMNTEVMVRHIYSKR